MLWPDLAAPWDPWRELERLQDEVSRVFSGLSAGRTRDFPAMNVWSTDDAVVVTAEVPGIDPKDLDISVVNDTLTVRGERKPHELGDGERYHRRERGHGQFVRTIQLPFRIDADKVEAKVSKGVLVVNLPRAAEDRRRRIAVEAA
ncbi:MAG: Hsp20/alpha crystallin family protein [Nitrospirae bacterium]|nr:MAG: Hsp20/alpha crystallin family protein [Nitrospirota bacterium]